MSVWLTLVDGWMCPGALKSRALHTHLAYYSKNFFLLFEKLQGVGMKEEWPLEIKWESGDQNKIKWFTVKVDSL